MEQRHLKREVVLAVIISLVIFAILAIGAMFGAFMFMGRIEDNRLAHRLHQLEQKKKRL